VVDADRTTATRYSFCALEALVRSSARRPLCVSTALGDDTLAYFSERLDPSVTRGALAAILRQAKRNKAFDNSRFIGLALDGTTVGRCGEWGCPLWRPLWRPFRNANKEVIGYRHHQGALGVRRLASNPTDRILLGDFCWRAKKSYLFCVVLYAGIFPDVGS
jgi:hypothetical protein